MMASAIPSGMLSGLLLASVVRAAPLLIAALGVLTAERSGVLNLGIEGIMLCGAMSAFATTVATGSPALGLGVALIVGAAIGFLYAAVVVSLRADQVVSGLALGFLCGGIASVLGAPLAAEPHKIVTLPAAVVPLLSVLLLGLTSGLFRTRLGLRLTAVGENPFAADAVGISVLRYRYGATVWSAALASLAGATISVAITPIWVDDLTAGQGFIAVGLVVVARWRASSAAWVALLFGLLRRLPLELQGEMQILSPVFGNPNLSHLFEMIPYLGTVIVLVLRTRPGVAHFFAAPSMLGIPYVRGER